jgi:hypothetical protein
MVAMVDPDSGETMAHADLPEATDPALAEWLASEMDGELLEVLHRFRTKEKGDPPEGPRSDIDLDEVEEYHLAAVENLLEGTRPDDYVVGDRRYWAAVLLCPTPGCDCHEAQVVFFDDKRGSDDIIGSVLLDIGGPSGFEVVDKAPGEPPDGPLEDLWALFRQRHDVASYLRRRQAQMKEVGATLWKPVARPVRVGPKIGRNAPCPCGSGRKYKKCCLGKRDASPDGIPADGPDRDGR